MTPRQLRLLRGAAASSMSTIIAAVSHTIGGGSPPQPLLVLALSILLTPLAAFLVGRTLNVTKLSATVALAQAAFHVLFVALGAALRPGTNTGQNSQHAHHGHHLVLGSITSSIAPDDSMLGAHVLAAALTVVLLWRGERILGFIARWVRAALVRRLPRLHGEWSAPCAHAAAAPRPNHQLWASDLSLRGPPVCLRGPSPADVIIAV
ncbi:hypothetical protein ACW5CM_04895 [Microbacterium sp. A588]